jgi:hypothetical protein
MIAVYVLNIVLVAFVFIGMLTLLIGAILKDRAAGETFERRARRQSRPRPVSAGRPSLSRA